MVVGETHHFWKHPYIYIYIIPRGDRRISSTNNNSKLLGPGAPQDEIFPQITNKTDS